MYVCICTGVTEADIRRAANEGASSLEHLRTHLGVAETCGTCACAAEELLDDAREGLAENDAAAGCMTALPATSPV